MILLDVAGYSQLSEAQLQRFSRTVWSDAYDAVLHGEPCYLNTWGDGVFAVFHRAIAAVEVALNVRDTFVHFGWSGEDLPPLGIRAAVHVGEVSISKLEVSGRQAIVPSRVEPVVENNRVFATAPVVFLLKYSDVGHVMADYIGQKPLAKGWGRDHLYSLRWKGDSPYPRTSLRNVVERITGSGSFF